MLAFALRHAMRNKQRRIIFVLPYLNIIEQNSTVYKRVFSELHEVDRPFIVEDHSLAHAAAYCEADADMDDAGEKADYVRKFSENWDAPVIITTTVKFFETLFADRPAKCRKLHNLANSIIVFDEAQTLPLSVTIPTLGALSHLQKEYGCSIVFSTATQPAFSHLDDHVAKLAAGGWKTKEIVPAKLKLFARARRVETIWPQENSRTSFEALAEKMLGDEQSLCIVNTKRQARKLYRCIEAADSEGLHYLSTDMCMQHRQSVLHEIRACLEKGRKCRLVATQCVEAGVDIDFPVAYRAWGPLEAIVQAAGRCNREGKLSKGKFEVFLPELDEENYPDGLYKQAAGIAALLFKEYGQSLDLQDASVFDEYYRKLFYFARPEEASPELIESILAGDFTATARLYRIIKDNTVNVLVPYEKNVYDALREEIELAGRITRDWVRRARPYSVSLFRPADGSDVWSRLVPAGAGKTAGRQNSDWFIYLRPEHYDANLGLVIPDDPDFLYVG
jgi:CRISPR-associated endonuclease/helicase Cas3